MNVKFIINFWGFLTLIPEYARGESIPGYIPEYAQGESIPGYEGLKYILPSRFCNYHFSPNRVKPLPKILVHQFNLNL